MVTFAIFSIKDTKNLEAHSYKNESFDLIRFIILLIILIYTILISFVEVASKIFLIIFHNEGDNID